MSIVLTVPHAKCSLGPEYGHHYCDTHATRGAQALKKAIEGIGLDVKTFVAETPRKDCDMNRAESRNHSWRLKIDQTLDRGDVKYLLDVHSFPPTTTYNWNKYAIVFMTLGDAKKWHIKLIMDVNRDLKSADLHAGWVKGSQENDIMFCASLKGVRNVLLEFSECLTDDQITTIASTIARRLKRAIDQGGHDNNAIGVVPPET
jgi:hypothetical protein